MAGRGGARGRGGGRGRSGGMHTAFPHLQPAAPQPPVATPQDTASFRPLPAPGESSEYSQIFYQTITCTWPHTTFSLEELRLNDYANGRGIVSKAWENGYQPHGFNATSHGLVNASVPSAVGWQHTSCRTPASLDLEFGSDMVTLRVGKEDAATDFTIHRNIIIRRSPFMKQALNGEWQEAATGVLKMPTDEPGVVKLYQKWLYTGCIFSDPPRSALQASVNEHEQLVKCYLFGDKLLDCTFKDTVIDAIIALLMSTHVFDPSLTALTYESTTQASPLRKLWQDIYIFCGSPSWLDHSHDPHADFAIDLSRRQLSFWQGVRPQDAAKVLLEPCQYHEHENGKRYRVSSVPVINDRARQVVSAMWS